MDVNRRSVGSLGEDIASAFLKLKGFSIIARNYQYARREVDLLAKKDNCLAAVEVKLRRGRLFGTAIEAVDKRKLARLQIALEGYVKTLPRGINHRIDLVLIDIDLNGTDMHVRHLENVY